MDTDEHRFAKVMVGAIVALLGLRGQALAQPACGFEVVIVHPNPCGQFGPPPTTGWGLNSFGHVAGHHEKCSNQLDVAFLWTPQTGMVDLQMPEDAVRSRALDVNDNGWTVGWVSIRGDDLGSLGFLHDGETAITLGTLPGGNYSQATAINRAGQVTGVWGNNVIGNPAAEAFIWQNGGMTGLGDDLNTPNSQASDINKEGQITGWMGLSSNIDSHAFIWDNGKVTELPFIPGGFTSAGRDISDNGDVVGWGWRFDKGLQRDIRRAFLWTNNQMIDLGTLPGNTDSTAAGVNNAGEVIGFSSNAGIGGSWFIWQDGVMSDLNDLVPPEFTASVKAINNAGEIAGSGNGTEVGFPGMALLIPQPRPQGDLDLDCEVGVADLLILLGDWGPCEGCDADLDGNGVVGVKDLLILLGNWG